MTRLVSPILSGTTSILRPRNPCAADETGLNGAPVTRSSDLGFQTHAFIEAAYISGVTVATPRKSLASLYLTPPRHTYPAGCQGHKTSFEQQCSTRERIGRTSPASKSSSIGISHGVMLGTIKFCGNLQALYSHSDVISIAAFGKSTFPV